MTPNPAGPAATADGPPPPSAPAGEPPAALDLEALRRTVADVLGIAPERIGDDDNLVALGVDSVKVMTISARLRAYRVRAGFARMIEEPSLRAWWRLAAESPRGGRRPAPGDNGAQRPESGGGARSQPQPRADGGKPPGAHGEGRPA
ncbi:phosphopantetheine-binding protein [Actinacidiphila sp. ITFR-21]|uniref:phosphopantetheine-binding protein n=1 Tax=Actinacidiphila sp. ITFR-21 TaxID=3075199 RepID=UPI00288A0380|nr:phosphopantetheine-binding protein [Streptomyces sp. ITFR-21]WNI18925.1 phosphopantetheine-binding protein [Streptomyces sp. ITFR-21]